MKKAFVLLLVLALGLSLCACGGEKEESSITIVPETAVATYLGDPTANYPLLKNLFGEWKPERQANEDDPFQNSILIQEDGSCVIDGKTGRWEVDDSNSAENRVCVYIYLDGTHTGYVMYHSENDICSILHSDFMFSNVGWGRADGTTMLAPAAPAYTTVEITMDNWQNYLELRWTEPFWSEDAFGDATAYNQNLQLVIREEYAGLVNTDSIDIAFSYDWHNQYYYYDVDFEAKTFQLGEQVPPDNMYETNYRSGSSQGISMTMKTYNVQYLSLRPDFGSFIDRNDTPTLKIDDVQINRIQGTLEMKAN